MMMRTASLMSHAKRIQYQSSWVHRLAALEAADNNNVKHHGCVRGLGAGNGASVTIVSCWMTNAAMAESGAVPRETANIKKIGPSKAVSNDGRIHSSARIVSERTSFS